MRLALDAMGGDHAPQQMVLGAIDYAKLYPAHTVVLVGQEDRIRTELEQAQALDLGNIAIEHAPEVIAMGDKISALKDKPNDSMNVAARLVKSGAADAMVLCGNTGCSVAAAQLHLRRIPGVKRAGILTPLPTVKRPTWVIDCGANAVGKPEHLVQFATMGDAFLRSSLDVSEPRVGVLNIGSEDEKGDSLTTDTMALVKQTQLNSVGFVEGNHIYTGDVDLVVCDGFTGNVVLKTSEGVAKALTQIIKEEARRSVWRMLGGLLMKPVFTALRRRTHWSLVGGCPLLGVNGITIICHGRSDRVAVCSGLRQAARCVDTDLIGALTSCLAAQQHSANTVATETNQSSGAERVGA